MFHYNHYNDSRMCIRTYTANSQSSHILFSPEVCELLLVNFASRAFGCGAERRLLTVTATLQVSTAAVHARCRC